MAPGDWIFFSIPYPRNAVFYNVWRIGTLGRAESEGERGRGLARWRGWGGGRCEETVIIIEFSNHSTGNSNGIQTPVSSFNQVIRVFWLFFLVPVDLYMYIYNLLNVVLYISLLTFFFSPTFSFYQLNSSTYYYDTTTEHLYPNSLPDFFLLYFIWMFFDASRWLFLKAPLTFNRQVYNDIISDVNNGVSIDINVCSSSHPLKKIVSSSDLIWSIFHFLTVSAKVTCGGARCSPTMANLQKLPSIPSGKPFTQDVYTGTLQSCQVAEHSTTQFLLLLLLLSASFSV